MKLIKYIILSLFLFSSFMAGAQKYALKTNILYDATASPNLGVEIGIAPKWTAELSGGLNLWKFSNNKQWRHYLIQPEVRYWLCDRFGGHFFGFALHGGQYNIGGFNGRWNLLGTDARKLADHRYQGWFAGAGVSYGYAFMLDKHWNLEAEVGVGYSYTRYDMFQCTGCGKKIKSDRPHNYVGPTKAAINIVYVF